MKLVGPLPRCNGRNQWSSEIPTCVVEISSSFGIKANSTKGLEIYFLFDTSSSVLEKPFDLKTEFEFAKRLVERIKPFKGYLNVGIIMFASSSITALDITENLQYPPSPDRIIKVLDDVYQKAIDHEYEKKAGMRTNTAFALKKLGNVIHAAGHMVDNRRHVFTFTDGRHNEGEDPVKVRKSMENEFHPDIEFYSITACASCSFSNQEELVGLASRPENYVFIEDVYQLSTYLDQVTDFKIDYAKCGQVGRGVQSITKEATSLRFRRSVNAENAEEGAWPWQALITLGDATPEQALGDDNLRGGGSILNRHWILTAAHLFGYDSKPHNWMDAYVISVGVLERPGYGETLVSTIQMYSMADYIDHEDFNKKSFLNDIALIKVGPKYNSDMSRDMKHVGGIEFGYYVRPVCLPCKNTCITKKHLRPYINDRMSSEEKCLEEEKLLLTRDAKVVATGYGHQDKVGDGFIRIRNFPRKLQQALLKLKDDSTCQRGAQIINNMAEREIVTYTDKTICCGSGDPHKAIGTCLGDNGGPLVREVRDSETGETCWTQIGIVSFGWGCGREEVPEYYTNVAKYVSWIDEKMQQSDAEP